MRDEMSDKAFETLKQKVADRITKRCDEYGLESTTLVNYVINGWEPGGFLTAVLEDKLVESAARADDHNLSRLYYWAQVMYSEVPADARGSREKVTKWLRHGGLCGLYPVEKVS